MIGEGMEGSRFCVSCGAALYGPFCGQCGTNVAEKVRLRQEAAKTASLPPKPVVVEEERDKQECTTGKTAKAVPTPRMCTVCHKPRKNHTCTGACTGCTNDRYHPELRTRKKAISLFKDVDNTVELNGLFKSSKKRTQTSRGTGYSAQQPRRTGRVSMRGGWKETHER